MTDIPPIHGFCDDVCEPIRQAFIQNFADQVEIGASIALIHQGKYLMDLWAGYTDEARTVPWQKESIACIFSTSKVSINLCILMLIDRGLLELDKPIAHYWPAFGQAGKETITTRQVMCHRAGIPGLDVIEEHEFFIWDEIIKLIEVQRPWFEPGTQLCYHGTTYGHILGEIVRRLTGQPPEVFLETNLDISTMHHSHDLF
jgi:CubicO group peptidase (beta-lactamase class C family)